MTDKALARPDLRQIVLGLFVCVQLVFLVGMNTFPLIPHGRPGTDELIDDPTLHGRTSDIELVQDGIELGATACRRYAELTGQWQGWSLFAPLHPTQATFLVVELRWNAVAGGSAPPSIRLPSRFVPEDPLHHVRPPNTWGRLFNYEFRLCKVLWFYSDEDYERRPGEWRDHVREQVTRMHKSTRAYLRWRMETYLASHPEVLPPDELILYIQIHRSTPPGQPSAERPGPFLRPIARWRPQEPANAIEPLDPMTGEAIPARPGREVE